MSSVLLKFFVFGDISVVIKNERIHTELSTSDFYYELPEALIAQHPLERRDSSRLMVVERDGVGIEHKVFLHIC